MTDLLHDSDDQELVEPEFWVGIGASAGGLEALRGFVRNLPSDLPATYVVAQHMSPQHRSMLAEIIGRDTDMVVADVVDGLVPEANALYVTPPDSNIIVADGAFHLIDPSSEPAAPKPSVDVLLSSMASELGNRVIGVILSGTGSDGAEGIRKIRKGGGVTVAQDEMTAKYASMPMAAIETGCVDLVMSPEELGSQFPKLVEHPRDLEALRSSPLDMDSTAELLQLLLNRNGVNFRLYKTATVQRRIERRMAAISVQSLEDYVDAARSSPEEVDALFRDLLVSVTSFFRDPDEFLALRAHIRQIVQSKPDEPIRIWVAATATGEEAYTIAMLFAEEMGGPRAFANSRVQIFATDVDDQAIDVARRGYYPETALDAIPQELIDSYFETAVSGYTVKKALRDKIVFSVHDVIQDPPYLNLDLISCRNLLIYFQANLQKQVFARFHYALVPRGVLFLGKAEAVAAADDLFRPAKSDRHVFFQRPSKEHRVLSDYGQSLNMKTRRTVIGVPLAADPAEVEIVNGRFDSLVAAVGPNALLVGEDLKVSRIYGDVERYVALSAGVVDMALHSLLREPYRRELQAVVPASLRRKESSRGMVRADPDDPTRREQVNVFVIDGGPEDDQFALIVFNEWQIETGDGSGGEAPVDDTTEVERLRTELAYANTQLRHLVQDAEANSEELQSLNEELQASNEELQSTNEELETSNEELQSTNEELSTVNEELQVNAQQLNTVNQSLRNILENVAIPMLVVDRRLNITNASGASTRVFGIDPDLTLPHVSRCRLPDGFPNLVGLLEEAMDDQRRIDRIIDDGEHSATITAVPHFSTSGEVVGGIVLVSDNTEELRRTRNELQLVLDNLPAVIIVRRRDGLVTKANRMAIETIGAGDEQLEGRNFRDFCDDESAAAVEQFDAEAWASDTPVLTRDLVHRSLDGQRRIFNTSRFPVRDGGEESDDLMYSMAIDVTEQRKATAAVALSESRLDQAVRAAELGYWEWELETDEVFLSEQLRKILGLTDEEFSGQGDDFLALFHPDDLPLVRASLKDRISARKPGSGTSRIRRSNGTYRWIATTTEARVDEHDTVIAIAGTARDITVQRESEARLRALNEQLTLASTLSGVGFWQIDVEKGSLFWSDEVFKIHGVDSADWTPDLESAIDFYHPDDVAMVTTYVESAMAEGKSWEFDARIVRHDGATRHVRSRGAVDLDEHGATRSVHGVFQDITGDRERAIELERLLEELSRSNEELSRFSYVCSHDMKEPVRMIETMSNLLLDPEVSADEERRNELLKRIGRNMGRLRIIIDSLLAYSRLEAKVEFVDMELDDVVREVVDTMQPTINESNATVTYGELPPFVGARVHFLQLFQNLTMNAIKHSDKDQPLIAISAELGDERQLIRVEDNGPGIAAEDRGRIFELFGRLDASQGIEGAGLGLSICQRIATQYGGTITCVDSSLGGAAFEISLPTERNN